MDPQIIGVLGLAAMVFLIITGMRIAFAAALIGLLGLWLLAGANPAMTLVGLLPHDITANYVFSVLPLFVIMGHFAYFAGFTRDIFWTGRQWVGRLPGGLALATIIGGAGFAAACGASTASAAVLTKACLPELEKYNYDPRLSTGAIASVGTLAAMIPPSALMVIYGIMVEQSIAKLLIAGFLPGLLTAVMYMSMIVLRVWRNPSLGPPVYGITWKERFVSLKGTWGILVMAGLVMGGIYTGFFTPTEAGAAGAMGAFLIALMQKRLTRSSLWEALMDTGRTTSMVFLIIVGILIFTRFLAYTRVTYVVGEFLVGLPVPPVTIVIGVMVLYLFLGMFLDGIGMLILTLPIVYPAMQALGVDPIWFGVLIVHVIEVGLVTPPVGLNVYVVKGVAPQVPLETIFRGILPFVLTDFVTLAILIAFPQISLFLPNLMK